MSSADDTTPQSSRIIRPARASQQFQQLHRESAHHETLESTRTSPGSTAAAAASPRRGSCTTTSGGDDAKFLMSPSVTSIGSETSLTSKGSNWIASMELSLATRRRLIRKPLPQLPNQNQDAAGGEEYLNAADAEARTEEEELQAVEDWWPNALPDFAEDLPSTTGSLLFPRRQTTQHHGSGLDDQSSEHLLTILHYAALSPLQDPARACKSSMAGSNHPYTVEPRLLDALYNALSEALVYLSRKETLAALQRTASIRWRAEAQLRNASAVNNSNADASQASTSKWPRFAWPTAVLRRAYREAQRETLPPLPTEAAADEDGMDDAYHPFAGDPRIRKRDVAIKILSNAVWFVRNYGPNAGVETLYGRHLGAVNGASGLFGERSDSADGGAHREDQAGEHGEAGSSAQGPTASTPRRASENLMKLNVGRPNFLSKSSATTALSGTATPESVTEASSPVPPACATPSGEANGSIETETSAPGLARTESPKVEVATEKSEMLPPRPAPPVDAAPSKAMEHLASLNAASGAALRAKAQALHGAEGGGDVFAEGISQRLAHQTSRPSLRSATSYRTEAEAAETTALEKAEREYLAMLGKGCDEWAKMVICRICASFEVIDEGNKDTLKARGGTATQSLAQQLKAGEPQTSSTISSRSDMTAKASKMGQEADADRPIVWLPEQYLGDDVFGGSQGGLRGLRNSCDHNDRVKVVGGSFHVCVENQEQKKALLSILELVVYAGCSMILEAVFLRDSDAPRPKVVRVPTRSTSTTSPTQAEPSIKSRPIEVQVPQRHQSTLLSQKGAGGGDLREPPEEAPLSLPSSPASSHKGASTRRWTKSLWGMIHSRPSSSPDADSEEAVTASASSRGDRLAAGGDARRVSLQLTRTLSGNGRGVVEQRRSSKGSGSGVGRDGLPRSKTISQHKPKSSISSITTSIGAALSSMHAGDHSDSGSASLNSRTNSKLGRLVGAFGRHLPDGVATQRSANEDDAGDDGREASIGTMEARNSQASGSARPSVDDHRRDATSTATAAMQPEPVSRFPLANPGPCPLSSSPELCLLDLYQLPGIEPERRGYIAAFLRLQSLGFLCSERPDGITFATPSNGISASGQLLPQVGIKDSTWRSGVSASYGSSLHSLASHRAHQLLSSELRHASALEGYQRREVAFYKRLSNSRDVPLGQVIEELCVRAGSLEAEEGVQSHAAAEAKASKHHSAPAGKSAPEQRIHFLHGEYQVKVIATMLPAKTLGRGVGKSSEGAARLSAEADSAADETTGKGCQNSVSSLSTFADDADVSAVAAALDADKDAAKTAVAVAETAVQAAELGTQALVDGKTSSECSIWMWNANGSSGWQGRARQMSESTYLMSFARYLESILYHPALQRVAGMESPSQQAVKHAADAGLQKQLREGREEDSRGIAEGSRLLRMFRSGRAVVKVHAQPIRIYELAIDGPVMNGRPSTTSVVTAASDRKMLREERAKLQETALRASLEDIRLEVQNFFASVKQRMTALEDLFVARELDESGKTIRTKNPADLIASVFSDNDDDAAESSTTGSGFAPSIDSRISAVSESLSEPLRLLTRLQTSLRTDEFELYDALKMVKGFENVNGIRRAFADRAKSAKNRLGAWIKKHLTKGEQAHLGAHAFVEPEYFFAGRHAFPGSSFLVRESEPLSIIAFSLSSRDFKTELGTWNEPTSDAKGDGSGGDHLGPSKEEHVLRWRSGIVGSSGPGSQISTAGSFVSSSPLRDREAARNVPISQRDPDTDEVFYEPEPVRTTLKRKKRARETSILTLRLRKVGSSISSSVSERHTSRSSIVLNDNDNDGGSSLCGGEHDQDGSKTADKAGSAIVGADSTDDDDTDTDVGSVVDARAAAHSSQASRVVRPGHALQPAPRSSSLIQQRPSFTGAQRPVSCAGPPSIANTSTISTAATDSTFRAQVTQVSGRPLSLASIFSKDTDDSSRDTTPGLLGENGATNGACMGDSLTVGHDQQMSRLPAASRMQMHKTSRSISESVTSSTISSMTIDGVSLAPSSALPTPSITSTSGAGISGTALASTPSASGGTAARVESPHIKHNLIHSSTKISCVSWFAEEFAALREKWGVEHDFAQSLSRCSNWSTTGGKSKSAFFKTQDERYIGKQLLTVWSVDEKESFLEFAPAYLKYMMNSVVNDCPTLLVKIAGVYSIKIKDVKTGETRLKMNVMIQENLWAGDGNRSIKFDLKGIKDRKAKVSPQAATSRGGATTPGNAEAATLATPAKATLGNVGTALNTPQPASRSVSGTATPHSVAQGPHKVGTAHPLPSSSSVAAPAGASTTGEEQSASATASLGSASLATVWWDSDWIGRYKSKAFVAERQKDLFDRALQNDTAFLTASNVMDYSLLLGVLETPPSPEMDAGLATPGEEARDETSHRPAIRARIVDFLGAFTLAKQLESSSKKALKSGLEAKGNVTILPPSEYAARFKASLESYFIGVPTLNTESGRGGEHLPSGDDDGGPASFGPVL